MPPTDAPPRKGGRPPKIANAKRWFCYVPREVQAAASAVAVRNGTTLPEVIRALMADYAAGRVTPVENGPEQDGAR